MRKLVTVQKVLGVFPIEGADAIERVQVLGWNVVGRKGEFTTGQKIGYFELDAFLPEANPVYADFQARGQKEFTHDGITEKGHVLKTVRLRGVYSQGLILSLEALGFTAEEIATAEVGTEITDRVGVVKWEPPLPMDNGQTLGVFDTRFAPKTDALRVQGFTEDQFALLKTVAWEPTLKVDGTSQTLVNDPEKGFRIFGRNWELSLDSAGYTIAKEFGLTEAIQEFPGMAVQFERVGAGVQGDKLKVGKNRPVVFAVWRDGRKVPRTQWPSGVLKFATPVLGEEYDPKNFTTAQELVEFVDGIRGNQYGADVLHEGVVWHPVDPEEVAHWDFLDRNGNWKVISSKFLLKNG